MVAAQGTFFSWEKIALSCIAVGVFFAVFVLSAISLGREVYKRTRTSSFPLRCGIMTILMLSSALRVMLFSSSIAFWAGVTLSVPSRFFFLTIASPVAFYTDFSAKNLIIMQLAEMWIKLLAMSVVQKRIYVRRVRWTVSVVLCCCLLISCIWIIVGSADEFEAFIVAYRASQIICLLLSAIVHAVVGSGLYFTVSRLHIGADSVTSALLRATLIVGVCFISFWARAAILIAYLVSDRVDEAFIVGTLPDVLYFVFVEAIPSMCILLILAKPVSRRATIMDSGSPPPLRASRLQPVMLNT